jgi:hypothetical protein
MLSLIGSLLGFGTSFLPKVMDFFQDKADKKHELAMIAAQADAQAKLETAKLEGIVVDAEIRQIEAAHREQSEAVAKASRWVVNLSASVRPVMTYLFFLEFIGLTVATFFGLLDAAEYEMIWNGEMQAIWAAVVSFWFGSRSFNRKGHS